MHFLSDAQMRCPTCKGRRFKPEVLTVRYRGHNIADVLDMTIEDANELFQDLPQVTSILSLLKRHIREGSCVLYCTDVVRGEREERWRIQP